MDSKVIRERNILVVLFWLEFSHWLSEASWPCVGTKIWDKNYLRSSNSASSRSKRVLICWNISCLNSFNWSVWTFQSEPFGHRAVCFFYYWTVQEEVIRSASKLFSLVDFSDLERKDWSRPGNRSHFFCIQITISSRFFGKKSNLTLFCDHRTLWSFILINLGGLYQYF